MGSLGSLVSRFSGNSSEGWREWYDPTLYYLSTLELADLVREWVDDEQTNYGMMLEDDFDANWWDFNASIEDSGVVRDGLNELEVLFYRYYSDKGSHQGDRTKRPYLLVTAEPIPEPATIILFILSGGLFSLFKIGKRKKS